MVPVNNNEDFTPAQLSWSATAFGLNLVPGVVWPHARSNQPTSMRLQRRDFVKPVPQSHQNTLGGFRIAVWKFGAMNCSIATEKRSSDRRFSM